MNMNPRKSLKIYPRLDKGFKAKKSLNFDMMKSLLFIERGDPDQAKLMRWISYFAIGFITGLIAFLMEIVEEYAVELRNLGVVSIMDVWIKKNEGLAQLFAWAFLGAWCFAIAALASYLTITQGPGANGSGIAELIAYLNGVNMPKLIGWGTFIIKSVCVVMGIAAQLCIGKEGPLAHIGANVAILLVYYMPFNVFQYYRNDVMKREFVCAGIAAGVSAAFGSPIGGTLFSYELSKPSTFWTFSMIWRSFFCAAVSTYTLSFFVHWHEHGLTDLTLTAAGTLKFGELQDAKVLLEDIHGPIVLGIIGGLLGSLFINVNTSMAVFRKKYVTTIPRKVVEAGMYGLATMSVCVIFIAFLSSGCQKIVDQDESSNSSLLKEPADELSQHNL